MERNKVLITGAGGYLGHELLRQLMKNDIPAIAMSSMPKKLETEFTDAEKIEFVSNDYARENSALWDSVDTVVHLAFARRFRPNSEIAESLLFSKKLFETVRDHQVPRLINMSSQSVYGSTELMRTEKTRVSPEMIYSFAKYASEVVLDLAISNTDTKATNIRLDSIAQNQNLLPSLVRNSFEKSEITIVGGEQIFSLLDVRDAASALIDLIKTPGEVWKREYNVGWNKTIYTLNQIADLVSTHVKKHSGNEVKINRKPEDIRTFDAGMDSTLFITDTGWTPKYDINAIIEAVIDAYLASK